MCIRDSDWAIRLKTLWGCTDTMGLSIGEPFQPALRKLFAPLVEANNDGEGQADE